MPFCPVTPWSARAFNSLWFSKGTRRACGITDLSSYFHRLDAVQGWNRALGPRGFVQYQFAVPDGEERVMTEVLQAVHSERCAPFLGTLKRFGPSAGGRLSFPLPGWSLAIDMPAANTRLAPLLRRMDAQVAAAGGRVYLAKDGCLDDETFSAMYGRLPQWQETRARLDPAGVFRSDLGRRLGLC